MPKTKTPSDKEYISSEALTLCLLSAVYFSVAVGTGSQGPAHNSPPQKREGNWAKLTIVKPSGTLNKGMGKKWPMAYFRCVPSSDPRNNCGIYFGTSLLIVSKVANKVITKSIRKNEFTTCKRKLPLKKLTSWSLAAAMICFRTTVIVLLAAFRVCRARVVFEITSTSRPVTSLVSWRKVKILI